MVHSGKLGAARLFNLAKFDWLFLAFSSKCKSHVRKNDGNVFAASSPNAMGASSWTPPPPSKTER